MNINRFALPASIAAALHAALFFLSPAIPARFRDGPPGKVVQPIDPPPVDRIQMESEDDPTEASDVTDVRPGTQPPVLPDQPATTNRPDFIVDVPHDSFRSNAIEPLGPIGLPGPNGVDDSGHRFRPILPAGDLDRVPRPTVQMSPNYPEILRQAGVAGEVLVEFSVDATGRVTSARVLNSTRSEFSEPTVRAVLRWRFEPGRYHGRVVPFRMVVPVEFSTAGV